MKYRKKPVEIEAIKFEFDRWVYERQTAYPMVWGEDLGNGMTAVNPHIKTLEGNMAVSDGDYIIKGVQGEFYPCKPDIFEQTYEKVEEESELAKALKDNCPICGRKFESE